MSLLRFGVVETLVVAVARRPGFVRIPSRQFVNPGFQPCVERLHLGRAVRNVERMLFQRVFGVVVEPSVPVIFVLLVVGAPCGPRVGLVGPQRVEVQQRELPFERLLPTEFRLERYAFRAPLPGISIPMASAIVGMKSVRSTSRSLTRPSRILSPHAISRGTCVP